jgi:hypothetical protein
MSVYRKTLDDKSLSDNYLKDGSSSSLVKRKREAAQEKFKKAYCMSDRVYEVWISQKNHPMRGYP